MFTDTGAAALIGGKAVAVGDTVAWYYITSIGDAQVTVHNLKTGTEHRLKME